MNFYRPEVAKDQDYYPFGMLQSGRSFAPGGVYRYGFNGKENDGEVKGEGNQQDYGMRIYDPRVGRFLSVDPLSAKFPWNSVYAYAEDKPIMYDDLDGLEIPETMPAARAYPIRPALSNYLVDREGNISGGYK